MFARANLSLLYARTQIFYASSILIDIAICGGQSTRFVFAMKPIHLDVLRFFHSWHIGSAINACTFISDSVHNSSSSSLKNHCGKSGISPKKTRMQLPCVAYPITSFFRCMKKSAPRCGCRYIFYNICMMMRSIKSFIFVCNFLRRSICFFILLSMAFNRL